MRKLDFVEYKTCQIHATIFEKSIELAHFSSPMFIRRFMMCDELTESFDKKSYLMLSNNEEDLIYELNQKYKSSTKDVMYSPDEMYWIGYIYQALVYLYNKTSKQIYKLFPAKQIIKYYPTYHTFDIEEAAERMMENVGITIEVTDYTKKGVRILQRLLYIDKLREMIGKEVVVYVDKPIGYQEENNGTYSINCGYLKQYLNHLEEKQEAYVLGVNKPVNTFKGKVIGIVNRKDDNRDILLIAPKNSKMKTSDINKSIYFKEKNYNHKIIRK